MKSSIKKTKECKTILTVEVDADQIHQHYKEVLKQFQKEAVLPGFRPGTAPADMVEKKYAKEAEEEMLKSLVPQAYHQSIFEHKVNPVSLPAISDIKLEKGKKLTFTAEVETAPEFSVKGYKGIKIKKVEAQTSDEDVQKTMQSLLDSKAEFIPVEEQRAVKKGDFVVTDIDSLQEGKYVPTKKDVLLNVDENDKDDFCDKIVGAFVNDVREISVENKPFYKILIREIREKKLPQLNEEFAKLYGKENIEELKEAIRKDIFRFKSEESQTQMKTELFEKLLKLVDFELPKGLIEKQQQRLMEQAVNQFARSGMPPKQFEAQKTEIEADALKKANQQVKLFFILERIAETEDIHEDEMEVQSRLEAMAEQSQRPMDEVHQTFEEDIRQSTREKKTVDFLMGNANFEETK